MPFVWLQVVALGSVQVTAEWKEVDEKVSELLLMLY